MKKWSDGVMEWWSDAHETSHYSNTPKLQYYNYSFFRR
jgi:hypothetical protein